MTAPRPGEPPLVELVGLSKTFGSFRALSEVSLAVRAGEVMGLLGENGSGKSTLIKVLAGFHAPDPGAKLLIRGEFVQLPILPGTFRKLGISFVHQDLAMVPELSVAENMRVAQGVAGRRAFVSWRAERAQVARTFAEFGLDIDPAAPVESLGETDRALVAILRAVGELGDQRTLLVLDEPTVFLPREGTDLLFRVVRDLVADRRCGVLLVSHDLNEVLKHSDRVTVLRDGRVQGTVESASSTPRELTELIVGRELAAAVRQPTLTKRRAVAATVTGLRGPRLVSLDVELGVGEIVGMTGLAGSGYEHVLPSLYGAEPASGTLELEGKTLQLDRLTPAKALRSRIVFVPADRKREGSVAELTVEQNLTIPVLDQLRSGVALRPKALAARSRALVEQYDVRPRDTTAIFGNLSGGNQQKAVLAKWLQTDPRLVLLAEPTQGVDVGARAHIFGLLREVAAKGVPIVVASSDYEQLATICDRVLVLARGEVVEELTGEDLTPQVMSERVLSSTSLHPSRLEV